MAHPNSYPVCPTCEHVLSPEKADLEYFVKVGPKAHSADDHADLYEEAHRILAMLGALAQAAPRAVADCDDQPDRDWVMWLAWLAEELTDEGERRI